MFRVFGFIVFQTLKDTLLRSFNRMQLMDIDMIKHSSRPEWPAVLHNLCYLHGAIRLRARFGRGGWNVPQDLMQIGNIELHVKTMFITEIFVGCNIIVLSRFCHSFSLHFFSLLS